jgi:Family of unknown function (DUF6353)
MNQTWLNSLNRLIKDNSTTILSATAVGGVVATAVLAVKGREKARKRLSVVERLEPRDFKAAVREDWQCYIPAGLSGAATVACIIGANQIGLRRNAALLGAYTLADTAFREYKDAVVAEIGEVKDRKIREAVAEKQMADNPVKNSEVIITGIGEQLCYEPLSGRYFRSDIEQIRRAANDVDADVLQNMYSPLNEFYKLVGLPSTELGEHLGWNIDHRIDLVFATQLSEDGQPCLAVTHRQLPVYDYGKIHP